MQMPATTPPPKHNQTMIPRPVPPGANLEVIDDAESNSSNNEPRYPHCHRTAPDYLLPIIRH